MSRATRSVTSPSRDRWLPRERLWVALLLVACACLDLYRLGTPSLFDKDETTYARIAVEMVRTGDPVTLHFNGIPWYVHPPFHLWLLAMTGRVLGFDELTVRIWSAFFGILGVYATVLLGRALFGARVGLLAGAILGVTPQYLAQSRLVVFDTVLLAWMLLAFYAFYRGYATGRRAEYLKFFLFAGLATLTKGPIGLVLPGLVMVGFVTARRAWGRWREVPWLAGMAIYAGVGWSWYAVEALLHGQSFVSLVFGYYMVGRFFGVVENQPGPWYYYVPLVLLGAFPWATFWPAAAGFHVRRWRADGSLAVLLWCAVIFTFYTVAGTKLRNYILPIYPFAAIAVAALWEPALEARSVGRAVGISLALLGVLLAALFGGLIESFGGGYTGAYHALRHSLVIPAGILAVGTGVALALAVRGRSFATLMALWATMAVVWAGVLTWVVPAVESLKPMKPLALTIKRALEPGDRLIGYRDQIGFLNSLLFYADHRVEWVDTPEILRADLCAPGRVFLVTTSEDLAAVRSVLPVGLEAFTQRGDMVVLLKRASERCARGYPMTSVGA